MLIHSDILSEGIISSCVPARCYLAAHYDRSDNWGSVHTLKSRKRERAYSVRLSGSSKSTMQRIPDKAATWDQWGEFIWSLFVIDPKAIIGEYASYEDFIAKTTEEHNRISQYRPDMLPTHSAPWLNHN